MKNPINLQTRIPLPSEVKLINKKDFGHFLVGAEGDYFLTRVLLFLGFNDVGMYHYQQCIEKFLKAYLIQNNSTFRGTHDLEELRELCAKFDTFFNDKDVIDACKKITPFEVVGRYPSELLRSFGWTMPDIFYFLDEFVFEMRKRINHQGVFDNINELQNNSVLPMAIDEKFSTISIEHFFKNNNYFTQKKL